MAIRLRNRKPFCDWRQGSTSQSVLRRQCERFAFAFEPCSGRQSAYIDVLS